MQQKVTGVCPEQVFLRDVVERHRLSLIKEAQLQMEKARRTVNKTLPMLTSALREQKEGVKGDQREESFLAKKGRKTFSQRKLKMSDRTKDGCTRRERSLRGKMISDVLSQN